MSVLTPEPKVSNQPSDGAGANFDIQRKRMRFLGLTLDECIKYFFEGNAVVSVVVLALITLFLFKEGIGFFGQNDRNITMYRRAGLEYVDLIRAEEQDHTALTRYVSDIRQRYAQHLMNGQGLTLAQTNEVLAGFDAFADSYAATIDPLRALVSDLSDQASAIKTKAIVEDDKRHERELLLKEGRQAEAAKVVLETIDFEQELKPVLATRSQLRTLNADLQQALESSLATAPKMPTPELEQRMLRLRELTRKYIGGFGVVEKQVEAWDYSVPVPWYRSLSSFLFGRQWLTASFWQDWYGIIPLLVGSLLVSFVALLIAVPLGIGAAIYVNQLASTREQKFIKPCIEFISAIPSVVLGFFGIAVLGETLRALSHTKAFDWVPGFPFSERLNILTAGCLLAVIALPTIFTLAEDALNNVPRAFKEASFAMGATRLQTILKIIAPAALSGIISAVLLGFGRVIGETMVVLLCAGNRISIPDFTEGLSVVTQPVHTMTGIIAQEMGEVVRGSIHYRALFVVGIVLFFLSLGINYLAQKVVRKYRITTG